jgi:hypothetical protein
MKKHLILILLLLSISALSKAETATNVYQVTLRAEQGDMRFFVCINRECQKSLDYIKKQGEYFYDFGTFPVPTPEDIDLTVLKHHPEIRRVRRAKEQYAPGICTISNCGNFSFTKVNTPATSTTDTCKIGLSCGRGGPGLR